MQSSPRSLSRLQAHLFGNSREEEYSQVFHEYTVEQKNNKVKHQSNELLKEQFVGKGQNLDHAKR